MNNTIAEKGQYKLTLGTGTDQQRCYLLVNSDTGVIEVETKILPQAYQYLNDLSSGLEEAERAYITPLSVDVTDNVVSIQSTN